MALEDRLCMALGDGIDGALRVAVELVRTRARRHPPSRRVREAEEQVPATVIRQGDQPFGQFGTYHRVIQVEPVFDLGGHLFSRVVEQLTEAPLGVESGPTEPNPSDLNTADVEPIEDVRALVHGADGYVEGVR